MNITKVPVIQIIKNGEIIEVNPLTSTNDIGVSSGSLKLITSIVDKELSFGELYSSQFSVQLFNIDDNLEGCEIQLFLEEDGTRISKFKGIIDSSKRDNIGGYRDIIAYDWIYYNRDYDISNWWNNFWVNTRTNATIQEIRTSLLTYINMIDIKGYPSNSIYPSNELYPQDVTDSYINDSIVIPNNFNFYTDLKLHIILKMICELQAIFPHIDENGNMEFISISNTNTSDLTGLYEGNNSKWEDYTTELITGVGIYSTSNDLSQLIGTSDNVYNISGNLFALTLDAQTLNTLGNNILSAISGIQFTPSKIKMIVSDFDLKLGQRINTPKGYGYVMTNSLSGVCLIEQTIESKSMGSKLSQRVDSRNDTLIEGAKMSKFEQDIDGFTLEVQRIDNVATQASNDANTALNNSNRAIVTDTLHYLATSQESGVTTSTSGWTTTTQSVTATNKYLWTYHTYTYADSHTSDTTPAISGVYGDKGAKGDKGEDGDDGTSVSITSTSVTYQVGSSGTTAPTGTWQSTPQATTTGQFLWTRTIVNYSNGTSTTSYSVSAHGSTGSRGATGIGISEVTPLYYVSNSATVPSAPTSQVTTTTTTSYNTWTKGIPAMTTTYKYMYTCDQVKYTNNTFAWTTPVLDNALSTAVSEIKQMADQIVLKVQADGTIAKVELGAEASTGSKVVIKGDNIELDGNVKVTDGFVLKAGVIQSDNYVANTSGMKITLSNGAVDSKNFKIDSSGNVSATNLYATNIVFCENLLYNFNNNNYYFVKLRTSGTDLFGYSLYNSAGNEAIRLGDINYAVIAPNWLYGGWRVNDYLSVCGYGSGKGLWVTHSDDTVGVTITTDDEGGQINIYGLGTTMTNWLIDCYDNASLRFLHSNGKWIRFANDGTIWYSNNARRCVGSYTNTSFTTVTDILKITSSNYAVLATGSGNFSFSIASWSDSALKKNIKDSQVNALDIINTIKMREFDFKEKEYGTHEDIGYVADELVKIIPEAVVEVPISDEDKEKYGKDTLYQVNDGAIVKYLVKALQELSKEVKRLKNGGKEE